MRRMGMIIFALSGIMIFESVYKPTASIEVKITHITHKTGQIEVYLFRNPGNFPVHKDRAYRHQSVSIGSGEVKVMFRDVPYGEYAVSVYQDVNGNGRFDRNFIGMPAEPYALSGEPRFRFGPPLFGDCKIRVEKPLVRLQLELKE